PCTAPFPYTTLFRSRGTFSGHGAKGCGGLPASRWLAHGSFRLLDGPSSGRALRVGFAHHRPVCQELQGSTELPDTDDFHRGHPRRRFSLARLRSESQACSHSHSQHQPGLQGNRRRYFSLELHPAYLAVQQRLRRGRTFPRRQNVPARIRPLPLVVSASHRRGRFRALSVPPRAIWTNGRSSAVVYGRGGEKYFLVPS